MHLNSLYSRIFQNEVSPTNKSVYVIITYAVVVILCLNNRNWTLWQKDLRFATSHAVCLVRSTMFGQMQESTNERRGSVMVSTSACHAADPGSFPGPGMCHY